MKMKIDDQKRGFTLVEMMIVVGISSMLMGAMYVATHIAYVEQNQAIDTEMTVREQARDGIYQMVQDIRQSATGQVTITSGGGAIETIQFRVPKVKIPGEAPTSTSQGLRDYTVDWGSSDLIRYAVGGANNRQIIRTNTATGQTRVLANDVVSLDYNNAADPDIVELTMQVQRQTASGRAVPANPLQITGKAELRNV